LIAADKRKSFYEDLVQVGDKDSCGCGTPAGKLAEECLTEYMNGFHARNPNFHVFNAVMHVDEATPHLHINYIPIGHYKRGLDTQNGYNQALNEMGFKGADCFKNWRERERAVLRDICKAHGLEVKPKEEEKGRGYSFTVEEYKEEKDRVKEEIKALETVKEELKSEIEWIKREGEHLSTSVTQLKAENDGLGKEFYSLTEKKKVLEGELDKLSAEVKEFRKKSDKVKAGKDFMLDNSDNHKLDCLSDELDEYLKSPLKIPFYKENILNVFREMKKQLKKAYKIAEKASSFAFKQWELCEKAYEANKRLGEYVPKLESENKTLKEKIVGLSEANQSFKEIKELTRRFLEKKGLKQECNAFMGEQRMLEQQARQEAQERKKAVERDDFDDFSPSR